MAQRKYELATAYVRIMPSMSGLSAAVGREMSRALRQGANDAPVEATLGRRVAAAVRGGVQNASWGDVGSKVFSALGTGVSKFTAPLSSALMTGVRGAGTLFADTLKTGASAAGLTLSAAIGAVGTQVVAGGLNRALGINEATAGLKAMGYEGQQFKAIMDAAGNAVDGTAYSMDQSVLAARNFLAAGVPEEKLQGYLQNVGKLADMGTRSYDDISTMLQSMAATGTIQGGDMLQLAQAGIPIFTALSKQLGVSVAEVKKLGSEGKITFDDLNQSIDQIDWDSALFAATDVRSAFANVRAQLSKIGANLWQPVIDKLPGILGDLRTFLQIIQKTIDFDPIQKRVSAFMERIAKIFDRFKNADGKLDADRVKSYTEMVGGDFYNLAKKLKGYEGIIAGATIGMSGSLLSSVPIIGPAFSRLTPLVGAFAGVLISAYNNSEDLRNTIKGLPALGKTIQSKLFSQVNINGEDLFKKVGDGISKGILWVQDIIIDAVDKLAEYMPQIQEFMTQVFKDMGTAFEEAGKNGLDGDAVAAVFKDLVKIFGTFAPLVFNVILDAATLAANVVKSNWFNTLVDWLAGIFQYFSQHSQVILTGLGVATALFVGGKLVALYKSMIAFMTDIKVLKPAADSAAAAGKGTVGSFKALFKSVGRLAIYVGLILAAIGGIGYLLEKTDYGSWVDTFTKQIFTTIGIIAEGVAKYVDGMLPTLAHFLDVLSTFVADFVQKLITAVLDPMISVITKLAGIGIQFAAAATTFVNSLTGLTLAAPVLLVSLQGFLQFLVDNGVAAGAGALAAAAGMAALMAAISGGSVATGAGNLIGSALSALGGDKGGGQLEQLQLALDSVLKISSIASTLPTVFLTTVALASAFGAQLPTAIAAGMLTTAAFVGTTLTTMMQSALSQQQSFLDQNPLIIRMELDQSSMPSNDSGSRNYGTSGGTYKTNNYKITSNGASIENLLKQGRGY